MRNESHKIASTIGEYTFYVGDTVITTDGVVGTITAICNCDECRKRGFFELFWEDESSEQFITDYSAKNGFEGFYRIGKYMFHPFEKDWIANLEEELSELRNQLVTIYDIEAAEGVIDAQ